MFIVGDIVYCLEPKSCLIVRAVVLAAEKTYYKVKPVAYVESDGFESEYCSGDAFMKLSGEVYGSCYEAYNSTDLEYAIKFKNYLSLLNSIDSLVEFPLHHILCGENMDRVARDAYVAKRDEFLGQGLLV